MRKGPLLFSCALLAVAAAVFFVPFLTEERDVPVSTPGTAPLFITPALIEIDPGERACADEVLLDPDAGIARFRVGTSGAPGAPLELTLQGSGYRERVDVGGGYPDNATLSVPIEGPDRELIGIACIENDGRRTMGLYASQEERTQSRIEVRVDGERVDVDLALAFYERERASIAGRVPEILDHMAAFRPIGPWLTWPLLVLVVLAVPALSLWALRRAFSARDDAPPR